MTALTVLTALTALYVPGDRPDRFAKAVAAGPDVVIVDLEDAVAPARKAEARELVRAWLAGPPLPSSQVAVQVRVNPVGSSGGAADLAALSSSIMAKRPSITGEERADRMLDLPFAHDRHLGGSGSGIGVRVPKATAAGLVDLAGQLPGVPLHPIVETAAGLEEAYAIASVAGVASLSLGEADLAADLGVTGDDGLLWARSRVVVAARAAGLPAPMMSVHPDIDDLDGLAASCAYGRTLGFVGRAAIHPRQLSVIVEAFRPSAVEVARAHEVLAALDAADGGVAVTASGVMVDAAMRGPAETVLRSAAATAR